MEEKPHEPDHGHEHPVTPLELFFDLVFVFAITQVTRLLVDDPTWGGVLSGGLVLAALWWAWNVYAWFTSALDADRGGIRLLILAAMGTMFGVALAVRGAFGADAVLFASAYFVVRMLHLRPLSGDASAIKAVEILEQDFLDRCGTSTCG